MIRPTQYTKTKKSGKTNASLHIDLGRFNNQYKKAQYWLDSQVMNDMEPYMPKRTGTFINITKAMSQAIAGSGKVIAAAPPYGRFLYYGKTMVDEETGSPFARKGAKKVLVSKYTGQTNARENLVFDTSKNAKATKEWFETAKNDNRKKWIKNVQKIAGGGNNAGEQ